MWWWGSPQPAHGRRVYRKDFVTVQGSDPFAPVPVLNRLLGLIHISTWLGLLIWSIAGLIGVGALLAYIAWQSGCAGSQPFTDILILSIAHIISFGEEGSVHEDPDQKSCILVTTIFSFISLLLQAALFGVTISRFLDPPSIELAISSRLCLVQRGGEQFLTVRVAHPQGFMVSDFHLHASFVERMRTTEGEVYFKRFDLEFVKWPYAMVPITIEHRLSDGPLAKFSGRFENADGWIQLTVIAQDEVLRSCVNNSIFYRPAQDIVHGQWADIYSSHFADSIYAEQSSHRQWHERLKDLLFLRHSMGAEYGNPLRADVSLANFHLLQAELPPVQPTRSVRSAQGSSRTASAPTELPSEERRASRASSIGLVESSQSTSVTSPLQREESTATRSGRATTQYASNI